MVGIDAIDFHVPSLVMPLSALAEARNIEYDKLRFGLGLEGMALCDLDEDAVTLGAEAAWKVIDKNDLRPEDIGRLYLGTESAVDAAKPTASYILEILTQRWRAKYGEATTSHIDVTDITFACVGGVDALLNCADWVRVKKDRKALVIASDVAKYELESTGEYTQGAGAVCSLVTHNPRILVLSEEVGVSTQSEADFFKPRRRFSKADLWRDLMSQDGDAKESEANFDEVKRRSTHTFWSSKDQVVEQFLETPVFDGPYSNDCYQARVREALSRFMEASGQHPEEWSGLVFHLPYAFQGRRMWPDIHFDLTRESKESISEKGGESFSEENRTAFVKTWSKTPEYKAYLKKTIAPGEVASQKIGNMYTASIFMSLISFLACAEGELSTLGFCAYGSGSKSKVFSGKLQSNWKESFSKTTSLETLSERREVSFESYENLHAGRLNQPLFPEKSIKLESIDQAVNREGYRNYGQ